MIISEDMKKIIAFVAFATILLIGCSSEENAPVLPKDGALDISASIYDNVPTKALKSGTTFVANDQILLALKGATPYIGRIGKYALSSVSSKWEPLTLTEKIILLDNAATVSAIYPSSTQPVGGLVDGQPLTTFSEWIISLPASETSLNSANQTDYMYALGSTTASGGLTNLAPQVTLSFEHIFSRISLVVNKGPKYSGKGKMTAFKLSKIAGFNAGTAKLNIWTPKTITWDNTTMVDELSFIASDTGVDLNAYNQSTPGTAVIAYGMLARVDDPSGITLKITVDGKEMSASLPLPNTDGAFIEGKNYKYTVTIDGTGLTISPIVSTLDWVDSATGDFEVK